MVIGEIFNNFWSGIILGSIGVGLLTLIFVYLINKVILSMKVLTYIADHIDEFVDNIQKKKPAIGKALRQRLIIGFRLAASELEKDDGKK